MKSGGRRPNPWVLWLAVTGLWTSATLMAIGNRWPEFDFGQNAFEARLVWFCLLLPPILFAVVIGATFSLRSRQKRTH